MAGELLRGYLPYLLLTWGVEVPLLSFALRGRAGWKRILAAGLVATGLTHPLLWFAWPRVVPLRHYLAFVASGESLVVLLEAAVLGVIALRGEVPARARWTSALLASLAANSASFAVGILLNA